MKRIKHAVKQTAIGYVPYAGITSVVIFILSLLVIVFMADYYKKQFDQLKDGSKALEEENSHLENEIQIREKENDHLNNLLWQKDQTIETCKIDHSVMIELIRRYRTDLIPKNRSIFIMTTQVEGKKTIVFCRSRQFDRVNCFTGQEK